MKGKQKISAKSLFASGVAVLLAVLILALVFTAVSLRRNAKGIDDYRAEIVVKVGKTSVPRYLFEFFCLEAAKGEQAEASGVYSGSAPKADDVRSGALRFTCEYISLLREAEKAGVTLTASEERRVDEDIAALFGGRDRDGTILKYYGLYESEYRAIRLNFLKIGKLLDERAAEVSPSDEYLKTVFDSNISVLGGGTGDVIFMNILTVDEATAKLRRDTLARICENVNSAPPEERETVMRSMFEMYNEQGFAGGDMRVVLDDNTAENYPGLFELFCNGDTGVCYGTEERDALFAVLIVEKNGLDSVRDNDKMKVLTNASVKRDYVEELLNDPEYAAVVLPAADRIDYSKFTDR